MELDLPLRVVAVRPPAGCDFGLQKGKGSDFEVVARQSSRGQSLTFDLSVRVQDNREDGAPNFLGPFVQGPVQERFLYIDVGQYAGQDETPWARRVKIHLASIDWDMIHQVRDNPGARLEARYEGTGKGGGPSCASVPLLDGGWRVVLPK